MESTKAAQTVDEPDGGLVGVVDEDELVGDGLVDDGLVDDELLVEEISIDGMCGVY